jgi:UTP--glucose-1-phosphate uridylyltransferase
MKAIIPAAGLGTRFLPATKSQPKEMLPVLAKPTIQYVVEEALAAGVDEVIIVSNCQKRSIEEHFSPDEALVSHLEAVGKKGYAEAVRHAGSLPVSFVEQVEPLGLGHAIHCAASRVLGGAEVAGAAEAEGTAEAAGAADVEVTAEAAGAAEAEGSAGGAGEAASPEPVEPFFVLLGDVLVPDNGLLPRMLAASRAHGGASVIAVLRVPREQVNRFGIVAGEPVADEALAGTLPADEFYADDTHAGAGVGREPAAEGAADDKLWCITGMVEKPSVETAPSNLAIFGRYLLSARVMHLLSHTAPGAGGEIQLTDALIELLEHEDVYAFVIDPDEGFDVGTIDDWLMTNLRLAQRDPALSLSFSRAAAWSQD